LKNTIYILRKPHSLKVQGVYPEGLAYRYYAIRQSLADKFVAASIGQSVTTWFVDRFDKTAE
jgi:hypothetical protein